MKRHIDAAPRDGSVIRAKALGRDRGWEPWTWDARNKLWRLHPVGTRILERDRDDQPVWWDAPPAPAEIAAPWRPGVDD